MSSILTATLNAPKTFIYILKVKLLNNKLTVETKAHINMILKQGTPKWIESRIKITEKTL